MDERILVTKEVTFSTRDFVAESQLQEGTHFRVGPRRTDGHAAVWFSAHGSEKYRAVFRDYSSMSLQLLCVDEDEAVRLVTQLQREFNEVIS